VSIEDSVLKKAIRRHWLKESSIGSNHIVVRLSQEELPGSAPNNSEVRSLVLQGFSFYFRGQRASYTAEPFLGLHQGQQQ
jgi:hypothetical protein